MFAALIAAGTFIAIPVGPVPIVLQNLFVLLGGLVLGPFLGCAAAGLYLFTGLIGAPVFAGFTAGISRFAGPTGGFLIGYLFMPLVSGLIAGRPDKKISRTRLITAVILGLITIYIPGVCWLSVLSNFDWYKALIAGLIPFIPGDLIKGTAAVLIAPGLRKTAAELLYV